MQMPASGPVVLRTNLAEYPVTTAVRHGLISSDVVQLDLCGPETAHDGFKAMLRENVFDAGELALVTCLQARAYGKPFVLLPLPLSGRFQHHCIAYNSEHGDLSPKDIEGRKVAVRTYSQTTGLWVRGILQHDYGVDLDRVTWLTVDEAHLTECQDPPNCERLPAGSRIARMIMDGSVAAAILGSDMPKDARLGTLIPNAREAAKEWNRREHVTPINHMIVIHQDISKRRPDAVRELFRMISESRAAAGEAVTASLPPIGLEANRKALEMAIDWSFEQKVIPRRLRLEELFDETTANLA